MSDQVAEKEFNSLDEAFGNVPALVDGSPSVVQHVAAADRVFGAQPVAVRRDERIILQKLKTLGGAVGEEWYYRFPVRDKGRKVYIEGPSIKLANDLSRTYGNCEVDVRVQDGPEHWIIYARFTDYETGFAMTRPFQQRKSQQTMGGDADRARDIAFQIGVSKAIRNVVVNALQTFSDYAFQAARGALVESIGKNIDGYRDKCAKRLGEMKIDVKRVEAVRGKELSTWLAPDIALTIGEIKSVTDGMASPEEMWPVAIEKQGGSKSLDDRLDQLADNSDTKQKSEPDASQGSDGGKSSPQGNAADKPSSDPSPRSDDGDPIATARRRGAEARQNGMSRKAVPKEYRSDEPLLAAYFDGFDTGEAEDREPGEEDGEE